MHFIQLEAWISNPLFLRLFLVEKVNLSFADWEVCYNILYARQNVKVVLTCAASWETCSLDFYTFNHPLQRGTTFRLGLWKPLALQKQVKICFIHFLCKKAEKNREKARKLRNNVFLNLHANAGRGVYSQKKLQNEPKT